MLCAPAPELDWLQAWAGHSLQNTVIMSCHVIFGATLAGALAAHNTNTYTVFSSGQAALAHVLCCCLLSRSLTLWLCSRCNLVQIAFTGCDDCPCAATNACTQVRAL